MKTANGMVVTMHYTLTDDSGTTIDSSAGREPLIYLHGYGNIIPGLETALEGSEAGFKSRIDVTASEGYGERDTNAVFEAPREQFPDDMDITPGTRVFADGPNGPIPFTIMEVTESNVKLDANHPLAGMNLHFDVEIIEVRAASDEEISHGHVHDGSHDHEH
jgi:FKBP-type peptidyl-prolyl cis-trans isomerase SlyD